MHFFRKLRKKLPHRNEIENHSSLKAFGSHWKSEELWTFNRNSVARGVAIGIFSAFLPMPFEIVVAVFLAVVLRGNIILAFSLVWISNPITWVPLYTPCYLLGVKILQINPITLTEMTTLKLNLNLAYHYVALWLGCLIIGTCLSTLSFFLINSFWRLRIRNEWENRKKRRQQTKQQN